MSPAKYGFLVLAGLSLLGCSKNQLTEFKMQRLAQLEIPRSVVDVYIRSDLIQTTNDRLEVKDILLTELVSELSRQGRFRAQLVDALPTTLQPGQQIGVIQGEILSGGESDPGQFTELATCKGGIGGRIASGTAAAIQGDAITLDSNAYVCLKGDLGSAAIELGSATLLTGLGIDAGVPPVNQVVGTYRYRNLSLYAEANFSFTMVGGQQEQQTLAVRADGGSFVRQLIDSQSYRNRVEAGPLPSIASLINSSKISLIPIPVKELVVAEGTWPSEIYYNQPQLPALSLQKLPVSERPQILKSLVRRAIDSFLRSVSPTTQRIEAMVAEGGREERAEDLLQQGKWSEARKRLEALQPNQRTAEDWYSLGLSYEGEHSAEMTMKRHDEPIWKPSTGIAETRMLPILSVGSSDVWPSIVDYSRNYLVEA